MARGVRPARALHDMELVALAAAGDRPAFGELARRHVGAVRALLERMGADARLADGLAQDAFVVAFETIGDFRGEGAFATWIKRIAARIYVRRWRRSRSRTPGNLPVAGAVEPDASASDDRLDLEFALNALSTPERICMALCYGVGLTHTEAAESLGLPLGAVKSHVKHGVAKVREGLDRRRLSGRI